MMARTKKVRRSAKPPDDKHPRIRQDPTTGFKEKIAWRLNIIDKGGPWGWDSVHPEVLWRDIHSKISDFETMSIPEVMNEGGSHNIPVSDLSKPARRRLDEIEQNDIDELFSLRLTGQKRIWGILERNVLKILWWDPEHQVYLSKKKYT